MGNLVIEQQVGGLEQSQPKAHRSYDSRVFLMLVILSFPVFFLVAIERRMAGTINHDIPGAKKGLFTDANEYAAATIALVFESR